MNELEAKGRLDTYKTCLCEKIRRLKKTVKVNQEKSRESTIIWEKSGITVD